MGYAILAELIVFIHLLYIGFVVGGQILIVAGAALRWGWIRNPVFRIAHLLAIAIVAVDAVAGVLCPLTEWEYAMRRSAGQTLEEEIPFVGRLVHAVIYYDLPGWAFTTAYVLFFLIVLATLLIVPPRFRRPGRERRAGGD